MLLQEDVKRPLHDIVRKNRYISGINGLITGLLLCVPGPAPTEDLRIPALDCPLDIIPPISKRLTFVSWVSFRVELRHDIANIS